MAFYIEGIIHILGRCTIYGDKGQGGQVFTGQLIGLLLPCLVLFRGLAWQIVTTQHYPPWCFGIVTAGDVLVDFGKVGAIVQGVTLEIGNDPISFLEQLLVQSLDRASLQHLFEHRMVRDHIETILDDLDATDKTT